MSRLCEEIDGRVKAFLERPIEGDWPYLAGSIVSVAVIVAVGVNSEGRREVLGLEIGPSEAETFWTAFLRKLTRRGLRGVKLAISDAHEGIKAAVTKVLSTTWQRCRVGLLKNPAVADSLEVRVTRGLGGECSDAGNAVSWSCSSLGSLSPAGAGRSHPRQGRSSPRSLLAARRGG